MKKWTKRIMELNFINNYVTFICKNCQRKPFLTKSDFLKLHEITLGNFCSKDCYVTYIFKNNDNNKIKSRKSDTNLSGNENQGESLHTASK